MLLHVFSMRLRTRSDSESLIALDLVRLVWIWIFSLLLLCTYTSPQNLSCQMRGIWRRQCHRSYSKFGELRNGLRIFTRLVNTVISIEWGPKEKSEVFRGRQFCKMLYLCPNFLGLIRVIGIVGSSIPKRKVKSEK